MQFWDSIINAALMGTDKKQLATQDMPGDLQEAATLIQENQTKDKEEKFLQLAALTFNYRQCGTLSIQKEIIMSPAPAEEKEYCSEAATQALNDIISEESIPLLRFWLQLCYQEQQVIFPENVPSLLNTGTQQKKLQLLIAACCGKRGEWLSSFNPEWNFSSTQSNEELWQTGTFEQRKEILRQIRKADPSKAREWVQQTWTQEDAATKASLLEILSENVTGADISFLESLSVEKSKKVKEAAIELLKQIPGSSVIKQYEEVVRQSVSVKKEKVLLGMVNKTVLQFQLPASVPDPIFKSGIQQMSSQKNTPDESFILYQLISYIPPAFWTEHLSSSPAEVIELFKRSDEGKEMFPAIGLAVSRFKAADWVTHFMNEEKSVYMDLVPFLDKKEREKYLMRFMGIDSMTTAAIQLATKEEEEWSIDFAKAIIRYTAKNPYQYNRSFYNQHIDLIPVQVVAELEKFTPEESLRTMWSNLSEYIIKLVTLKIQSIKAFNT